MHLYSYTPIPPYPYRPIDNQPCSIGSEPKFCFVLRIYPISVNMGLLMLMGLYAMTFVQSKHTGGR
jgi:hypothetical protein